MALLDIPRLDGSKVKCDTEARTLSYYRYRVKFTPLEWKILVYLYERRSTLVTRDELIQLIWGQSNDFPTRTIDVHVSSIRKKLAYIKGARIDSIYGKGYRLLMLNRF